MSIGIDKIGFATSQYVLNMADLALARGAEPEKFSKGLMLDATSITPITEDIVTLASDAAADILNDDDKKQTLFLKKISPKSWKKVFGLSKHVLNTRMAQQPIPNTSLELLQNMT